MEIPEAILELLARAAAPALPAGRIAEAAARLSGSPLPGLDAEGPLLRGLRRRPDLVKVVEGWRGPWKVLGPEPDALPPEVRAALERQGVAAGTWIVPLAPPLHDGGERPALRLLRRSLRYLGRMTELDSPRAAARWIRIIREAAALEEEWERDPDPGGGGGWSTPPPGPLAGA